MKAPRNKYRAIATVVDGVRFASKAEARRDAELVLLERAGKIEFLSRQPVFPLVVNGKKIGRFTGDWKYNETINHRVECVVEDRKGFSKGEAFRLRWKLVQALYPGYVWRLT